MAYAKQAWVDGVTPVDAAHMNHLEDGIAAALPPVQNGLWLKGAGGAAIWSPILATDVPGTVRLGGTVNGATGSLAWGTPGLAVVRTGIGAYTITSSAYSAPGALIFLSVYSTSVVGGGFQSQPNEWRVSLTTPSAYVDSDFGFVVFTPTGARLEK